MRTYFTFGFATMTGLLACLSMSTLKAQLVTNTSALNRSYSLFRRDEDISYNRALQLAAQKNWPLTLKGKHGKYAVLSGMDPIGFPIYKVIDNLSSAQTVGTTNLWPGGSTGLILTGNAANMKGRLAIWDGGAVRGTHVELRGRVIQKDGVTTLDDHATHTSGTMIATGVNLQAKGMAFAAPELDAYDFNNDISEMTAAAPNLYLSNHSYGTIAGWFYDEDNLQWDWYGAVGDTVDYKFGYYDSQTQARDSIAYNAPFYLIVQAASNNRGETGPPVDSPYYRYNSQNQLVLATGGRPATLSSNAYFKTIPTYGNAKDVLTVGAIEPIPNGYAQPSDVVMTYFSSWGPTSDGRIKPDLVADGDGVLSSISTSDYAYDTYSGTSMSTPNVTGTLFLLQQYYTSLHKDTAMRSATLKALAIHTADEAGTSPGPDYYYGWGLLDAVKAASVITASVTDSTQQILEKVLTAGTSDTVNIPVIASGKSNLMATIAWTDPPGPVNTTNLFDNSPRLINDLDLRIIRGTTVFMPWVMDPSHPANGATKGDNKVDNVERIEADSVRPGASYTIQITHKGTLARGQQAFSLIMSGVGGKGYCASAPTSSAGTRIDSVSLGGVHNKNAAGCTTYNDFTGLTARVQGNQSVPIYVALNSCDASSASRVVKVYIDYNNNGSFGDPGELVATSPVLTGTTAFSTSFMTPSTLTPGTVTRMRIVAVETTDPNTVSPCGSYGNGETQDYSVAFAQPSRDLKMMGLAYPINPACADSNQIVTVTVANVGTTTQKGIPVTATVYNGASTVAVLSGTYPDTIGAGNSITYTLPGTFFSNPGSTYTIVASTNLSGDQNSSNDTATFTIAISPAATNPSSGTATVCGGSTAILNVNNPDSSNTYLWYTSATGGSPIAQGYATSTTTTSPSGTYYFQSGGSGTVGPLNKTSLDTAGGYNAFYGNWVKYHAAVPMTLVSARLYTRYGGTISFIVADVDQSTIASNGSYSYLPYTTTTIHVFATSPHPQAPLSGLATQTNDPQDTGAIFYLNIPLPAGDHDIIIESLDSATIFRNASIPGNPYPVGSTNLFAWTGNSAGVTSTSVGTTYQGYYYFFYDSKITTADCSATGARTAVTSTTAQTPQVTQLGDSLLSSVATGNQWYLNGLAINGANGPIYLAKRSGTYLTVVTDSTTGCTQTSNSLAFVLTAVDTVAAPKGLTVTPNPTTGIVNINFTVTTSADLTFEVYDMLGRLMYKQANPSFIGPYSGQLNMSGYADGMYLLKITHGDNITVEKILVQH